MSSLDSVEPDTQRSLSAGSPTVHLDVWSDVQCSWCPVGARRLDAAVAASGAAGDGVEQLRYVAGRRLLLHASPA